MAGRFTELFSNATVTIEGHKFVVRRPGTADGIAWFKGIPALSRRSESASLADSLPDPETVIEGIEKYLVSVDDDPYDAKVNPASGIPFAVALPLYNFIFRLAVPQDEAALAGRILPE